MAYQLIWKEQGATAYLKGSVNDVELREIVSEFYGHKQFDSIKYLLINFLEVEIFDVTENALVRIGSMDRAAALSNPNVRVAIVVNNAAILDRLSSYEKGIQGTPWPISYFGSVNEAQAWITDRWIDGVRLD
jgi:hypothetical protein